MNDLSSYFQQPRARELAPAVYQSRGKAILGLVGAIGAGFVLGIPTSFVKRRHSLPWEPSHMLVAGLIWAVVLGALALVILVMMHRYVVLFQKGIAQQGTVVWSTNEPGARSWVRSQDESGPFMTLLVGEALPGGAPVALLGRPGSRLLLIASSPGVVRRASKWPPEAVPPEVMALTA